MTSGLTSLRARRLRLPLLVLLVLPALTLRALIPMGFMPEVGAGGGISIGLCPGDAAVLDSALTDYAPGPHAAHHHTHHAGGGPGAPGSTHHGPCLFAASGAAALTPALPALTLVVPAPGRVPEFSASGVFSPSILRTQSPRGPPSLV